jgi:hypothetical protein
MLNHALKKTYPRSDQFTISDMQEFIDLAVERGCPVTATVYYRSYTNSDTHTTSVDLSTSWNEEES